MERVVEVLLSKFEFSTGKNLGWDYLEFMNLYFYTATSTTCLKSVKTSQYLECREWQHQCFGKRETIRSQEASHLPQYARHFSRYPDTRLDGLGSLA